ncbi:tetratricopeptide repeat protein [Rodentibacter myodis]|uniref:Uncharacterized protein n=1 Tax=Rodentibacter myodis TaxID=1907939 RepID=A0A1V3JJK8_9PAST|nr:tetratricopeptide repeat protein [Rodentibacter myodis]OOF56971.1 hypothetical protein BKL49_10195 [Rodentibacter myodis]
MKRLKPGIYIGAVTALFSLSIWANTNTTDELESIVQKLQGDIIYHDYSTAELVEIGKKAIEGDPEAMEKVGNAFTDPPFLPKEYWTQEDKQSIEIGKSWYKKAIEAYQRKALEGGADSGYALCRLGKIYRDEYERYGVKNLVKSVEYYAEAKKRLLELVENGQASNKELYALTYVYIPYTPGSFTMGCFGAGIEPDITQAFKLIELLEKRHSDIHQYHFYIGEYYNKEGRYKEAMKWYEKGLEKYPKNAQIMIAIANLYKDEKVGWWKPGAEALKWYQRVLDIESGTGWGLTAWEKIAEIYEKGIGGVSKDLDKAKDTVMQSCKKSIFFSNEPLQDCEPLKEFYQRNPQMEGK